MEASSSGDAQEDSHVPGANTGGPHTKIPDFEVRIKEIDEAINAKPTVMNSNMPNPESSMTIAGKERRLGSNGSANKNQGSPLKALEKEMDDSHPQISKLLPKEVKFEVDRGETNGARKNSKCGPRKNKSKAQAIPKNVAGLNNGQVGFHEVSKESLKEEGWASMQTDFINQGKMEYTYLESEPKRIWEFLKQDHAEVTCMEKKMKLDEETRSLSILMATHLGSAEAAEQPRQVQ